MERQVYIAGALAGAHDLDQAHRLYEQLAEACKSAGFLPYLPHHCTDPEKHKNLSPEMILDTDITHIRESAFVVMYLGEPSLGVGYELAKAIDMQIPILAVYEKGRKISRLALGALERYYYGYVYPFESIEDVINWIEITLGQLMAENQ